LYGNACRVRGRRQKSRIAQLLMLTIWPSNAFQRKALAAPLGILSHRVDQGTLIYETDAGGRLGSPTSHLLSPQSFLGAGRHRPINMRWATNSPGNAFDDLFQGRGLYSRFPMVRIPALISESSRKLSNFCRKLQKLAQECRDNWLHHESGEAGHSVRFLTERRRARRTKVAHPSPTYKPGPGK